MLAHLPLLLADDPRAALTVGFGTGTTSGSMLLHDIAVDAVEIEEKIIEAAPLFSAINRGPMPTRISTSSWTMRATTSESWTGTSTSLRPMSLT